MMDLKEIIKWFFPGFSELLRNLGKMDWRVTFVCLFLLFNLCYAAEKENSVSEPNRTFLVGAKSFSFNLNSSDVVDNATNSQNVSKNNHQRSLEEIETGRTFGRPFKKMIAGLLPVIFSMGAASTWAMVATLVGIKTFFVTLLILKILLVAGAAKLGAVFGAKHNYHPQPHHHQEWAPHPQKEIHLHIHNGHHDSHGHPEIHEGYPSSPWAREGVSSSVPASLETKSVNLALDQAYSAGPQTISTPYGNYVKLEPVKVRKRRNNVAIHVET
ncbi:uncharacterized protein LOC105397749 [Plutella xylostella]|uniref:uncharacterized protein LOC105397749 n=1 Tax=Plutella xylostella TaxID=51655 RepID=UPI0020328F24|nr:uncharacterized protein LOC105397749 [Plutella xylostella]